MSGAASAILPITNLFMTVLRFRASRSAGYKKPFGCKKQIQSNLQKQTRNKANGKLKDRMVR
jgi:hypothetical protein